MPDYTKLTVPKLRELLASRSLPTNGLKNELIARLTTADANSKPEAPATPAAVPPAVETEEFSVDWEEPTAAAAATAIAPPQPAKPVRKSIAALFDSAPKPGDSAPTKNGNEPSSPSTVTSESAPPASAPVFAANLPTTSVDEEIARRKKRAERFGLSVQESEALKALERKKRFGIEEEEKVGGLDDALPELKRREMSQGRSRRGPGAPPAKKRAKLSSGNGVQSGRVQKAGVLLNAEDRRKAEERKKRFAT